MKTTKKKVDLAAAEADFQRKIEERRAAFPVREAVKVRDDFAIPGFCKHGIPAHCPHCAAGK